MQKFSNDAKFSFSCISKVCFTLRSRQIQFQKRIWRALSPAKEERPGIIIECKIGGQLSHVINVSLKVPDSRLEGDIQFNSLLKENEF